MFRLNGSNARALVRRALGPLGCLPRMVAPASRHGLPNARGGMLARKASALDGALGREAEHARRDPARRLLVADSARIPPFGSRSGERNPNLARSGSVRSGSVL